MPSVLSALMGCWERKAILIHHLTLLPYSICDVRTLS